MTISELNELSTTLLINLGMFELQFKKPSKNENKEAHAIDDRLCCVLNEFSVLARGHAVPNSWSYE